MVKYNLQINNGVEAFGTTGKTITANEVLETCDSAEGGSTGGGSNPGGGSNEEEIG